jgi:proton-coupled amino acid transporter
MASPRSIPTGTSVQSSRAVPVGSSSRIVSSTTATASSLAGTPPLPQIPPRVTGSPFQPRSFVERSAAAAVSSTDAGTSSRRSSLNGLGDKTAFAARNVSSALTAALGSPPSAPPAEIPVILDADSGTVTPRPEDSAFSTLADIPNEEKARVLRRHLVSAGERGGTSSKGTSKGNTPGRRSPDDADAAAGDSSVSTGSHRHEDDPFPIPYDAPGGDVT